MKRNKLFACALVAAGGLAAAVATAADPAKKNPRPAAPAAPAAAAEGQQPGLPPGWTVEDMQAMMAAGTPGKMHKHLAQHVGEWGGATSMWMGPGGGAPMSSDCTYSVTPMMDGRYIRGEMKGDMPGMGPYHGFGVTGYDNVAQQFVSTWIDNHSTGIMHGVGKLSPDGKTLTWKYTYHCPLTKKPTVMRQIETITGPGTKTLDMFGADPKTGKEYKMMRIEFKKKS